MSQEQPTTERVKAIVSRISAWYEAAHQIDNRLKVEREGWQGVEWARREVAMYDERIQRARALEAQLEDALAPVAEAVLALVKEGT